MAEAVASDLVEASLLFVMSQKLNAGKKNLALASY